MSLGIWTMSVTWGGVWDGRGLWLLGEALGWKGNMKRCGLAQCEIFCLGSRCVGLSLPPFLYLSPGTWEHSSPHGGCPATWASPGGHSSALAGSGGRPHLEKPGERAAHPPASTRTGPRGGKTVPSPTPNSLWQEIPPCPHFIYLFWF